jgi:hypothetical protein
MVDACRYKLIQTEIRVQNLHKVRPDLGLGAVTLLDGRCHKSQDLDGHFSDSELS